MKKPLIILAGPTAIGKTALSIEFAKAMDGAVISADSVQVYRHMDIGSAKIKREEMDGIPHYLIDELEPHEEFHVVRFQELAKKYMEKIYAEEKIPIITGGTGFYIQALLYDIDFTGNPKEDMDFTYRKKLEEKAVGQEGADILHDMLKEIDEKAAEDIHKNNVKRVIRALEYFHLTGKKISEHNEEERKKDSPYAFAYFVLNDEREKIYENINLRVDQMLSAGLVKEVEKLKEMGCTREMVSMQGLGYKEILNYLDGILTLEEAKYRIKRDTRHFAKRQLTWFRRIQDVIWINKPEFGYDKEEILKFMIQKATRIQDAIQ